MAKKVFLGVGHGGSDPGAVGILVEKEINLKMATACRDYLIARGVEVLMSRVKDENDPLEEEIRECNAYNPDLAVDCHNNAGGGDGFEVYYTLNGGTGKLLAQNIESEVKAIGQNSRGCKTRAGANNLDYYGFIRETKCPAVICEGVFVDNKADAAQADTDEECKAFGEAYARGILKTLGISDNATAPNNNTTAPNNNATAPNNNATSGITYKIQVGAYSVKSNADEMLAKVKAAGFNAFITAEQSGTAATTTVAPKPDIVYAIKTADNGWLPEVKNTEDYAGIENKAAVDVMIKLSDGAPLKYRVHTTDGKWLGWVTGYDKSDYYNGYAGDDKTPIDAIEIKCEKYTIKYKVSSVKSGAEYYPAVSDNTVSGSESYAGVFGKLVDKLVAWIE